MLCAFGYGLEVLYSSLLAVKKVERREEGGGDDQRSWGVLLKGKILMCG